MTSRTALLLCILTGVALEVGVGMASGRLEAWDSPLYWTIGLPIAFAVAVLVGLFSRGQSWLCAGAIVPAQMTAMVLRGRGGFDLWPLSLLAGAILGSPLLLAALIASRRRSRSA